MSIRSFLTLAEVGPCPRLLRYERIQKDGIIRHALYYVSRVGSYHKHTGFNRFERKSSPPPTDGEITEVDCHDPYIVKYRYDYHVRYVKPQQVPEYQQPHYFTHDNGGRPYVVYVSKPLRTVTVYGIPNRLHDRLPEDVDFDTSERLLYYTHLVCRLKRVAGVWIGKSPINAMTRFSGGYGSDMDGNSILVHHKGLQYTFIGHDVYSFQAHAPIQSFLSPVGNSDVPYPFARDVTGRHYFFLDRMTLKVVPAEYQTSAYEYFYQQQYIIGVGNPHVAEYMGFTKFYIGAESYNLTYRGDAASEYTRLTTDKELSSPDRKDDQPVELYLEDEQGQRVVLSEADYVALMARVGHERGFGTFSKVRVHQKRL